MMRKFILSILLLGLTFYVSAQPSEPIKNASDYLKGTITTELEASVAGEGVGSIGQNEVWSIMIKLNNSPDMSVQETFKKIIERTDKIYLASEWEVGWNGDALVCTLVLGDKENPIDERGVVVFIAFEKSNEALHLALKEQSKIREGR